MSKGNDAVSCHDNHDPLPRIIPFMPLLADTVHFLPSRDVVVRVEPDGTLFVVQPDTAPYQYGPTAQPGKPVPPITRPTMMYQGPQIVPPMVPLPVSSPGRNSPTPIIMGAPQVMSRGQGPAYHVEHSTSGEEDLHEGYQMDNVGFQALEIPLHDEGFDRLLVTYLDELSLEDIGNDPLVDGSPSARHPHDYDLRTVAQETPTPPALRPTRHEGRLQRTLPDSTEPPHSVLTTVEKVKGLPLVLSQGQGSPASLVWPMPLEMALLMNNRPGPVIYRSLPDGYVEEIISTDIQESHVDLHTGDVTYRSQSLSTELEEDEEFDRVLIPYEEMQMSVEDIEQDTSREDAADQSTADQDCITASVHRGVECIRRHVENSRKRKRSSDDDDAKRRRTG